MDRHVELINLLSLLDYKSPSDHRFLAHHGVKGMRWGVRNAPDEYVLRRMMGQNSRASGATREERKKLNKEGKQAWTQYKKNTSRKERNADTKAAYQSKADYLIDAALKNDMTLLQITSPNGIRTLISGKEFISELSAGKAFSPRDTELTGLEIRK